MVTALIVALTLVALPCAAAALVLFVMALAEVLRCTGDR